MIAPVKFFTALSAAAVLLGTAGAASAEDFASNGRTMEVRFGDLDLAQAENQKELRARINRAAARVCANGDLSVQQACKKKALAHVDTPVAAAIARAESGQRYAEAGNNKRAVVGN
ncbi:UrcA family protein [Sphingobium ummariense]|uniref:UrcA family protein n=1 Tax=Sphingobium ummariense RL-3 TaxID=1346791 RepID=T0J7K3_9SPHN|nr:UrcA family protein [Sphingobium ummariense]EQB30775.1 hypothetical protein M529_18030 [Sphingobium ummariense RL-3]EQB33956.1 hypothetical protein M529_01130 [Sphingobium ummariense RL-3]